MNEAALEKEMLVLKKVMGMSDTTKPGRVYSVTVPGVATISNEQSAEEINLVFDKLPTESKLKLLDHLIEQPGMSDENKKGLILIRSALRQEAVVVKSNSEILQNLDKLMSAKATAMPRVTKDKERTIRNEAVRAGRNDPCPCGSGRKVKKCHKEAYK